MKLDKLNEWLTLIANIGVLLGIAFLVVELDQSNRIAEREARTEVVTEGMELQRIFLESIDLPEFMIKISEADAELSAEEQLGARSYAQLITGRLANLNIAYETNLLSNDILRRQVTVLIRDIELTPGIYPYLAATIPPQGSAVAFDMVWKVIVGED